METQNNNSNEPIRRNFAVTIYGLPEELTPMKIREIVGGLASEGWKMNAARVTVRL